MAIDEQGTQGQEVVEDSPGKARACARRERGTLPRQLKSKEAVLLMQAPSWHMRRRTRLPLPRFRTPRRRLRLAVQQGTGNRPSGHTRPRISSVPPNTRCPWLPPCRRKGQPASRLPRFSSRHSSSCVFLLFSNRTTAAFQRTPSRACPLANRRGYLSATIPLSGTTAGKATTPGLPVCHCAFLTMSAAPTNSGSVSQRKRRNGTSREKRAWKTPPDKRPWL